LIERDIVTNKLNLLKGTEMIRRKTFMIRKQANERELLVKKLRAEKMIKSLKIGVCVSAPSHKLKVPTFNKTKKSRKAARAMIVVNEIGEKRCDHEKLIYLLEMADSVT
jgi:hypothetical protein